MKLYIQDCSWRGSIIVIANSQEEARELMKDAYNYEPDNDIEEDEIRHGFVYVNLGDC